MKKEKLILASQVLLWIAVIILLYLNFSKKSSSTDVAMPTGDGMKIAYFSLDSLQQSYEYFLSMKRTFAAKQNAAQEELLSIERRFQVQMKEYEKNIPTMTQAQAENEQKKLYQTRQQFEEKKQELQIKLVKDQEEFAGKVQLAVQDFIKLHHDEYPYDLVIALQPGLVFYSNSTFDITSKLIQDLNKDYKK